MNARILFHSLFERLLLNSVICWFVWINETNWAVYPLPLLVLVGYLWFTLFEWRFVCQTLVRFANNIHELKTTYWMDFSSLRPRKQLIVIWRLWIWDIPSKGLDFTWVQTVLVYKYDDYTWSHIRSKSNHVVHQSTKIGLVYSGFYQTQEDLQVKILEKVRSQLQTLFTPLKFPLLPRSLN